jgi:hypothetical protein
MLFSMDGRRGDALQLIVAAISLKRVELDTRLTLLPGYLITLEARQTLFMHVSNVSI